MSAVTVARCAVGSPPSSPCAGLGVLAGCSGVTYAETPLPTTAAPEAVEQRARRRRADVRTTRRSPTTRCPACRAAARSPDATMRDRSSKRGLLVVGVSADTYLFGARDPFTGSIEGFDIDMARAVAKAIFGDPEQAPAARHHGGRPASRCSRTGSVDMVARNMSMTCDRWNEIAFSAEYYRSGQKVLVSKALPAPRTSASPTSRASGSARPPARPR